MTKRAYALLSMMIAAASVPSEAASTKSGAVFVMTNDADKNEIVSFERTPDGSLYDGGRFATEGRGSGGVTDPLQSQGSLRMSQDRSLLFAVNAGSGTVSVFRVKKASLTLVDKAPTGGALPVAVAQWNDLVYVLNAGGPGSVVGFRLQSDNTIKQIHNSTVLLTANSSGASSIAISPDGQYVAVTERTPNNIDTFRIKANGTLTPIVMNHSSAPGVFAAIFSPQGSLITSETGPAGGVNASTLSSYSILSSGTVAPISAALPTLGNANCWNAVTPNGRWVYASNSGSSNIAGFSINSNGSVTPIGGTIAGVNPAGSASLDIAVTADSRFLYSLNSNTGVIGIFAIGQDGSLTRLGDAGDLPKMAGFNGIAAY